jgi:transposase
MHTTDKRTHFYKLALDGVSYTEIRLVLGIGETTIYRWRKELKIKRRKRGRPKARLTKY